MTIDELLASAEQCLVRMAQEDSGDLDAINTWANAAQAYAAAAQAMILAQAAPADAMDMARVFMVDTGN